MTPHNRLPEELVEAIKTRLRGGGSHATIAADLDVARSTVDRIARMYGIGLLRAPRMRDIRTVYVRPKNLDWMDRAACAGWRGFTEMHVAEQKRVCWSACKVRLDCLGRGLANEAVAEGTVYGGLEPRELARLRKERAGVGT